jgi:hypothetical protein
MRASEHLSAALEEIKREHRELEAPTFLQTRLQGAARRSTLPSTSVRWRWSWIAVATAMTLLALAATELVRKGMERHARYSGSVVATQSEQQALPLRAAEFVALPASQTLPEPLETTRLQVRVRIGDLRQWGVDVPELFSSEYAQAEFLVGEDGLARAVRVIRVKSAENGIGSAKKSGLRDD